MVMVRIRIHIKFGVRVKVSVSVNVSIRMAHQQRRYSCSMRAVTLASVVVWRPIRKIDSNESKQLKNIRYRVIILP